LNQYLFVNDAPSVFVDPFGLVLNEVSTRRNQAKLLAELRSAMVTSEAGKRIIEYLDDPSAGNVFAWAVEEGDRPRSSVADFYVADLQSYAHESYHQVQRIANRRNVAKKRPRFNEDVLCLGVYVSSDEFVRGPKSEEAAVEYQAVRVENIVRDQVWKAGGRKGPRPSPRLHYWSSVTILHPYGTIYKP
jgi:hypothetical protein